MKLLACCKKQWTFFGGIFRQFATPVEKALKNMLSNITENWIGKFMDEILNWLAENAMDSVAGTIEDKLEDWARRMQIPTMEELLESSETD